MLIQLRKLDTDENDSIIWIRADQIETLEGRDLAVGGTEIGLISGRRIIVADSVGDIRTAIQGRAYTPRPPGSLA